MRRLALLLLAVLYLACLAFAPSGGLVALDLGEPLLPPSLVHPLGTDDLGRDLLLAVLQGGRTSLTVAASATALALGLGLLVGLACAFSPPVVDEVWQRVIEIVASLPTLLLAILVAGLFGGSTLGLALVIGFTRWPVIARLVRVETMALLTEGHVRAAVALGCGVVAIARRHLLPALLPALGAASGIVFGGAILAEAALAFVGLGDPEATSWGRMIATGFAMVGLGWWLWAAPAAMVVLASALVALASADTVGGTRHGA